MSKKEPHPSDPDVVGTKAVFDDDAVAGTKAVFDAKATLAVMSQRPGVYRMLDANGDVLYVGKARNLKKRVSNYFRASGLDTKTMALVSHITAIDVTITNSESDALLLEQNLIKKFRPPYNIQLRDDKTYPYIMLTHKDVFPVRCARVCRCCKKYFVSGSVRTATSVIAAARVCSIR